MSKFTTTLRLLAAIALCQAAGLIGSIFTVSQVDTWYKTLVQPSFAPPSWLFGPVWITLYTLMGIALFLVWSAPKKIFDGQTTKKRKQALLIFGIQLALNAIWTPIFFGLHAIGSAFVTIILLLAAIIATMVLFYKVRPATVYLLVPYVVWVASATVLNGAIWALNRGV